MKKCLIIHKPMAAPAKPPAAPPEYESGGHEFESLRARQCFLHSFPGVIAGSVTGLIALPECAGRLASLFAAGTRSPFACRDSTGDTPWPPAACFSRFTSRTPHRPHHSRPSRPWSGRPLARSAARRRPHLSCGIDGGAGSAVPCHLPPRPASAPAPENAA